jgi:hypothetical protein
VRIALVAAALLVPSASGAGELSSMHSLEVRDASHRVTVTVDGRVARFHITHTLVSRDRRGDEAFLEVDLPGESAAVGLRARAHGRWIGGQLLDTEKADTRYQLLTTGGRPGAGGGAALLTWEDTGHVTLAAFPVARRQPAEVEIAAVAPLCYHAGLAVAYYPLPAAGSIASPAVTVDSARPHWLVRPGKRAPRAIRSRWEALSRECPGEDDQLAIVVEREPRAPLSAAAASLDLASGRRIVQVEIDAARELAPAPRRARVLFVLDGSRSLGSAGMTAQLDLVRGYLAAVPDATFEIVLYRRRAARLFGRFQPARRAAEALGRVPPRALALENGSNLDAGLALTGQLARGASGPVRVVAFNDDLVRGALDAPAMAAALGALPAGSIVHLIELEGGAGDFAWQRADDHALADPVMGTGGMLVSMSGDAAVSAGAAMFGLVRPLVVDGLRIDGAALGDLSGELDDEGALPAGYGLRVSALLEAGSPRDPLVARGRIWGRQLALPIVVDRTLEAAMPALLFGGTAWADLDDAEQADAARRGGVVSPATSLLVELDDRPTAHDEMLGTSGCGCETGGFHGGGKVGVGSIGTVHRGRRGPDPDRDALLAGALSAPLRACAALHGAAPVTLTIETTLDEVVDVSVNAGGRAALAACAADAAWALSLPASFDQPHATFRVPFDP